MAKNHQHCKPTLENRKIHFWPTLRDHTKKIYTLTTNILRIWKDIWINCQPIFSRPLYNIVF